MTSDVKPGGYVDRLLAYMRDNPRMIVPIVFLMAFGENVAVASLFIPATAILVGASFIFAASRANPWPLALSAGTGAALAFAASYWVGAYFQDSILQMWPMRDYPQLIKETHEYFDKYGVFGVALGHFFGPVRAAVSLVAGVIGMDQAQFHIANIIGAYAWGIGMMLPVFLVYYLSECARIRLFALVSWLLTPVRWVLRMGK